MDIPALNKVSALSHIVFFYIWEGDLPFQQLWFDDSRI